jgi:hypothetical protein
MRTKALLCVLIAGCGGQPSGDSNDEDLRRHRDMGMLGAPSTPSPPDLACTPTTCAAIGATCGSVADGCGGTLSCGGCAGGQTCTNNMCVGSNNSSGAPWASVIDPARAIEWSKAGVVGGIQNRTAVCATLNPGATAGQINSAIAACPSGQVVMLNAGTYNLADDGIVMKSGVTLRGAGADQTLLNFTTSNGCIGVWASVCFLGSEEWAGGWDTQPGDQNAADWTGGYAKGATEITLSNVGSTGISVGQYIYLDQANDTSPGTDFFICSATDTGCSLEGGAPGRVINGIERNQMQMVQVTAINGSKYTISPGLYSPNWRSSQAPGAWWPSSTIEYAGIENLSVDSSNDTVGATNLGFLNAANCWVKGVRLIRQGNERAMIRLTPAVHTTIENSYFYGGTGAAQHYGVETFSSSDNLIQNNIFQQTVCPLMLGSNLGSVYGYNYAIDDVYPGNWFIAGAGVHDGGVEYVLFEGNILPGVAADVFHGNGGFNTYFRNYLLGTDTGKTQATNSVQLFSYQRYYNFVGNVLGTPGYTSNYQADIAAGVETFANAYYLGNGDTLANDPMVISTLLRWGNCDVATGTCRFEPSEVPSAVAPYGNALPLSQGLPASFYLAAKPSWWPADTAWPPIGPDVTTGNLAGLNGHAHTVPAEDCFRNVMHAPADGTGAVLSFNASACYGG